MTDKELKVILENLIEGSDEDDKLASFAATIENEISSDDERYDKKGFYLVKAILNNDIDKLFISLTGWSLASLLKKARVIRDGCGEFLDDPIEAQFVSIWDHDEEIYTSCKMNPETFEVYDIEKVECPNGYNTCTAQYIEIDDYRFKVVQKDDLEENDKTTYWYD